MRKLFWLRGGSGSETSTAAPASSLPLHSCPTATSRAGGRCISRAPFPRPGRGPIAVSLPVGSTAGEAGPVPFRSVPPPSAASREAGSPLRSEEHTSELQSLRHLVCRLLLEKKKQQQD